MSEKKKERCTKEALSSDLRAILKLATEKQYLFSHNDAFALGYLAGKYRLNNLLLDKDKLKKACIKYDETDDLALLDTIAETLIDLDIISNKDNLL